MVADKIDTTLEERIRKVEAKIECLLAGSATFELPLVLTES